jgi:hypothetical protein
LPVRAVEIFVQEVNSIMQVVSDQTPLAGEHVLVGVPCLRRH